MQKIAYWCLSSVLWSGMACAQVAVKIGLEPELDACMGTATVKKITALHNAPKETAPSIHSLARGTRVFLCDEREDGRWQGVVLPRQAKQDCQVSSPKPTQAYRGACWSGWVRQDALNLQ